ncbi:MAG: hypothetical protein Q4E77_02720, partial [Conchiformibius sp.]|nr:hypothetical protein [Conchiformibius sp.]
LLVISDIIKNRLLDSDIDFDLLMYQLDVLFRLHNPHIQTRKEDFELWDDFKDKISTEYMDKVF